MSLDLELQYDGCDVEYAAAVRADGRESSTPRCPSSLTTHMRLAVQSADGELAEQWVVPVRCDGLQVRGCGPWPGHDSWVVEYEPRVFSGTYEFAWHYSWPQARTVFFAELVTTAAGTVVEGSLVEWGQTEANEVQDDRWEFVGNKVRIGSFECEGLGR